MIRNIMFGVLLSSCGLEAILQKKTGRKVILDFILGETLMLGVYDVITHYFVNLI